MAESETPKARGGRRGASSTEEQPKAPSESESAAGTSQVGAATAATVEAQTQHETEAIEESREAKMAAGADAGDEPTVTDAGEGTEATDGTSEEKAAQENLRAAPEALMRIGGAEPGGKAPLRDQAISNSARNPSPLSRIERLPGDQPDYTAANTNSVRSSASPIDYPGIPTRDEYNPNRVALARGMSTLPGEGHIALVGENDAPLTFAAIFPTYAAGAPGRAAVRVYERFTQPNVKVKNYSTRLFFAAGAIVPAGTVEKVRMALIEEAAAAATTRTP